MLNIKYLLLSCFLLVYYEVSLQSWQLLCPPPRCCFLGRCFTRCQLWSIVVMPGEVQPKEAVAAVSSWWAAQPFSIACSLYFSVEGSFVLVLILPFPWAVVLFVAFQISKLHLS